MGERGCVCMNEGCRCQAGRPCLMCAGGDHYYGEPAAPHPSDSERTPRTKAIEYALSLMKEHQRTAAPYHAVAIQRHMDALAIEAESERVSLDVDVPEFLRGLANERGYIKTSLDHALAEYARLSPSTGKDTGKGKLPEQPNQDAGGIPYWPEDRFLPYYPEDEGAK